jgi:hypothetical protein
MVTSDVAVGHRTMARIISPASRVPQDAAELGVYKGCCCKRKRKGPEFFWGVLVRLSFASNGWLFSNRLPFF